MSECQFDNAHHPRFCMTHFKLTDRDCSAELCDVGAGELRAEVKRLREELNLWMGRCDKMSSLVVVYHEELESQKEAPRRVVKALVVCKAELSLYHGIEEGRHQCPIQPSQGMVLAEEALAFAKGVLDGKE
jgi:hypothetical protein